MVTPIELPDWVRGTLLLGAGPGGVIVPILVDAAGQINILTRGVDVLGTVRTVRVDNVGQLYAILRGAGGNDVSVDGSGNLAAILKGLDGVGTVRPLLVDNLGQAIMVPRGNTGNYMSVDASGNLSAILQGEVAPGTLHIVSVDAAGRIIMVPFGVTTVAGTALVTQVDSTRDIQGLDGVTLRPVLVDASGQLVMVPRGNSGNYMAVDASGFLTAVLKGEYSGVLHTIAVDANGRIEAFALDGEDQWGKTLKTGNSELAGRLSPLRTYDWRGNTLYQCDFSQGMPTGYSAVVGTGAAVALDPMYWRTGGYSLKLTGASTAGGFAYYEMDQANPPARYLGLQVEFSNYPDGANFRATLEADYLGSLQRFGIGFNFATDQLEYRNNVGAWVDTYAHTFIHRPDCFYRMKMVVDIETGRYRRFLFLNHEFNMSAIFGWTTPTLYLPYVKAGFGMYSRLAQNDVCWLDNYVITTNEPA